MREAASDVWSAPHERAATKQSARPAAAHPGFDDMAPATSLLALRICASYSTRLAPSIRGHLVRNAAHVGSCIRLLARQELAHVLRRAATKRGKRVTTLERRHDPSFRVPGREL